MRSASVLGRPPATSHSAIQAVALDLFTSHGFDETTTDDIAEATGIGRRTLFRYFPSKFDIPWGQFDDSLGGLRQRLASMPQTLPAWEAVQRSVVLFNTFDQSVVSQHRMRMGLLLHTPSLQAHSVLMYARWRSVIADFVAIRMGGSSTDLLPRTAGHVSLALAISAYEQWLSSDATPLEDLLSEAMAALQSYVSDGR
jgi:mycofactocin system transcriptional regulator